MSIIGLLKNRNLILSLAVTLGLAAGDLSLWTEPLVVPTLALVLTVSIVGIAQGFSFRWSEFLRYGLLASGFSYLVMGSVIILLSFLFIPEPIIRMGYIVIAASPPGVAVIPFSLLLAGNSRFSLLGISGVYLGSIFLTPFAIFLASGVAVSPLALISLMTKLIVLPFLLSQAVLYLDAAPAVDRWRGYVVNWGFFLIVFTIIGLNREIFYRESGLLLRMSAVSFLSIFILPLLVVLGLKYLGYCRADIVSAGLISSIKNSAFGAAVALAVFSERTAVPAAVMSIFTVLYFIALGFVPTANKDDRDQKASRVRK